MLLDVKLHRVECMPVRANPTDAGADLKCIVSDVLYPGTSKMFNTGVSIRLPKGYVGLVFSRSSQGKIGVNLANSVGVIDAAYRGNIKVILTNNGDSPYEIAAYETKIAQLMVLPIALPYFGQVYEEDEIWNDTTRGTGGFGSTGV